LRPTKASNRRPAPHRSLRHVQRLGDIPSPPTLLPQMQRLQPPPFTKVAVLGGHPVSYVHGFRGKSFAQRSVNSQKRKATQKRLRLPSIVVRVLSARNARHSIGVRDIVGGRN